MVKVMNWFNSIPLKTIRFANRHWNYLGLMDG